MTFAVFLERKLLLAIRGQKYSFLRKLKNNFTIINMKLKSIITCALLIIAFEASAQEDENQRTLFGHKDKKSKEHVDVGFDAGIKLGYGNIDNRSTFDFDFEAGVVLGHSIEFGGFLDAFSTEKYTDKLLEDKLMYNSVYGGLFIKPVAMHQMPVHLAFPIKIGGGKVEYATAASRGYYDEDRYYYYENDDYRCEDDCPVFVFEPGVQLELNFFKKFHISGGVSYKFFNKLDLSYRADNTRIIKKKGLNGFFYGITFNFGLF